MTATQHCTAQPSPRQAYWPILYLAALAGWVDAVSFTQWNGLYVSFMSGNSTSFAVSAAHHHWAEAARRALVLCGFLLGVICGEWMGRLGSRRRTGWAALIEAGLLGVAALITDNRGAVSATVPLLAFAMGVQNTLLLRTGRVHIALTYVTGTIVHAGKALGAAICGERWWTAPIPYIAAWATFLCGAIAGAFAAGWSAAGAILIPALLLLPFAIATFLDDATAIPSLRRTDGR